MSMKIKLPTIAYEHVMSIADAEEKRCTIEAYEILIETYGYPNINDCGFPSAFIQGYVAAKQTNS